MGKNSKKQSRSRSKIFEFICRFLIFYEEANVDETEGKQCEIDAYDWNVLNVDHIRLFQSVR